MTVEPMSEAIDELPVDRLSVAAWMRLARVYTKIDRKSADAFRRAGLTTAQFDVLAQVGVREGCTQQEFATLLLVTKGNVCQVLDKMELRGWIMRKPAASGRSNHLYLTVEGWTLREEVLPAQEARITGLFSTLGPEDRLRLSGLLRVLERGLD